MHEIRGLYHKCRQIQTACSVVFGPVLIGIVVCILLGVIIGLGLAGRQIKPIYPRIQIIGLAMPMGIRVENIGVRTSTYPTDRVEIGDNLSFAWPTSKWSTPASNGGPPNGSKVLVHLQWSKRGMNGPCWSVQSWWPYLEEPKTIEWPDLDAALIDAVFRTSEIVSLAELWDGEDLFDVDATNDDMVVRFHHLKQGHEYVLKLYKGKWNMTYTLNVPVFTVSDPIPEWIRHFEINTSAEEPDAQS